MAVAFGRIRSKSRFLCRSALRKKPQSDKKKKAFKIKKLDKGKHKRLSLDHLYQNQNQGTTTCKHVVQHGDPEEQQNLHQQLHFHHHHSPRPPSPSPQPPKKRTHLPPSEHANTMGESSNHQRNHSHTFQSSRLGIGLRNSGTGGGEIVEVQGGHIVRSTGRKDRHSKVCTAKGPRDRRVRLAAHTAIQFYDVQDRLGYDRPSKAVDWLIKNAKSAIDELAELPAWNPITTCSAEPNASMFQQEQEHNHEQEQQEQHRHCIGNDLMIVNEQQGLHQTGNGAGGRNAQDSSFLPPSLDSDAIADTIKSFFPMGASAGPSSSAIQFQSFPTPDLLPRSTQSQDLRLSLQSFPDPAMLHHHNQNQHHQNPSHHAEQPHSQADHVLLSGIPLGFGGNAGGWPEQQVAELNRLHRLGNWYTSGGDTASGIGVESAAGYLSAPLLQQMFSHNNQFYSQRGPLQSSNTPSVRAWIDPAAVTIANSMADHNTSQQQQQENQPHHRHHPSFVPIYPSSLSGIGFSSGFGGFSGFHIPARIQGDEEEHDGYSDKPSSASSDSRH